MNGFNEACRVAIEKGGYKEKALEAIFMETTFDSLNDWYNGNQETYLVLDPLFWESLGKAKNQDPYEMYTTFMEAHWLGNDEEFWTELCL